MRNYMTISVDEGLLPQVLRELLSLANSPDDVEVVHGEDGREILVHPVLADAWVTSVRTRQEAAKLLEQAATAAPELPVPEPAPAPEPAPPAPPVAKSEPVAKAPTKATAAKAAQTSA